MMTKEEIVKIATMNTKKYKLADIMDLANVPYDKNSQDFLREFQGFVLNASKEKDPEIYMKVKNNIVTDPQTIGLSKDSHCLDGMEQIVDVIDKSYNLEPNLENTQTRTR